MLPNVGLFVRRGEGLVPLALAVELDGEPAVYTPSDGDRWARARAFFLQGCAIHLPLSEIACSIQF